MNSSQRDFYILIICIFLPFLFLLLFNISSEFFYNNAKDIEYLKNMIKILNIATFILTIILFVVVKRFAGTFRAEMREKQLKLTIFHFEEMAQKIGRQRHDFNNHLQMVYGLLDLGQFKKAKEYISTIYQDISIYNETLKSNNVELMALLHSKIGIARSKDINMELFIDGDLKQLILRPSEITSIIGNLIDNAVDAAESMKSEKRKIILSIERNEYYLLISTSNYTDEIQPDMIDLLFKNGYSTKKSSGIGLSIVKEIVQRNKGRIEGNINNGTITFTVIIPVNNKNDMPCS